MDLEASPSYAEVMAVRAERMALVRALVDGLTDDDLERGCTRAPAPGYPEELRTVASCLGVVMEEECEHHRYAMRDLAVLEARCPFSTLPPKFPANTGQSRSLSRRPQELSEGWSSFRA
ncbi:MAG: hypothetical protein QOE23_1875 [Pseudonocardiales bacterium]|jgi:hypothetical protein|nr:hypothetical protein [Pseudonocardiales bacterium]